MCPHSFLLAPAGESVNNVQWDSEGFDHVKFNLYTSRVKQHTQQSLLRHSKKKNEKKKPDDSSRKHPSLTHSMTHHLFSFYFIPPAPTPWDTFIFAIAFCFPVLFSVL